MLSICRPTVASTWTRWSRAVFSSVEQLSITESPSASIRPGGRGAWFFFWARPPECETTGGPLVTFTTGLTAACTFGGLT